jgi:hypothetical protein
MMVMNPCRSFLLLLFAGQAVAFTTDRLPASKKTIGGPLSSQLCDDLVNDATNRRQFFSRAFLTLLSPALLTSGASPAAADVSQGNALPQGAAQFGRIIRAKSDLIVRTVFYNGVFRPSSSSSFLYCPAHQIFSHSTWLVKLQTTLYYT